MYSLICAGTIEAAVERLLQQKRASAQLALDGGVEIPDARQLLGAAAEEADNRSPDQGEPSEAATSNSSAASIKLALRG